jgi:hypothetical protein
MDKAKELAELFVKELKWWVGAPAAVAARSERAFRDMLDNGYTYEVLEQAIYDYKRKHPTKEELSGLIKVNQILEGIDDPRLMVNLIEKDRFYYHPRLQVSLGARTLIINDDGEPEYVDADREYFLEMVSSFTLRDLCDYFYGKSGIRQRDYRKDAGGFQYVLNSLSPEEPLNKLDLMLYIIDEAIAKRFDEDLPMPKQAVDLKNYIDVGEDLYAARYDSSSKGGNTHVIARN